MNENLSYRALQETDFEKVCALPQNEEELFFMFPRAEYPLTIHQLKEAIASRYDSTVIIKEGEVVGFANFYEVVENRYCSIGNVIVSPKYRSEGIGDFLIRAMEHIGIEKYNVSEFHLSCFNNNTKGILLYSKLSYKPYETEKRFDKENNPVALIKMKKEV